jgi:hypothetical protein
VTKHLSRGLEHVGFVAKESVSGKDILPNTWVILFLIIIYPVFHIDWFVMLGINSGLITGHILSEI